MPKKPLSKEELIARLKAIAADDTPREVSMGAMCYSQMSPPTKHTKCNGCGCKITYHDWNTHDTIVDLVEKIKSLGYDVKVEVICQNCGEKLKKEIYPDCKSCDDEEFDWDNKVWISDINHAFYFRHTTDTEYHRAIANSVNNYKSLLILLQNKPMYRDRFDRSHYIADEISTLEFMTGINFNE